MLSIPIGEHLYASLAYNTVNRDNYIVLHSIEVWRSSFQRQMTLLRKESALASANYRPNLQTFVIIAMPALNSAFLALHVNPRLCGVQFRLVMQTRITLSDVG